MKFVGVYKNTLTGELIFSKEYEGNYDDEMRFLQQWVRDVSPYYLGNNLSDYVLYFEEVVEDDGIQVDPLPDGYPGAPKRS